MSLRSFRPPRFLLAAAVTTALVTGTGLPALAAPSSPSHPGPARAPLRAAAEPVLLINGDHALVGSADGGHTTQILPAPGVTGLAGAVSIVRAGSSTFLFPAAVLPFVGHGLAPSLFEVNALRRAEHSGVLPVVLHYRGKLHPVPGITITRRGTGTARGYLTASSAKAFGAALARQMLAGQTRGSTGDGPLTGGLSIGLPGALAAAPGAPARSRQPGGPKYTLTVRGTNLAGRPYTGYGVALMNVNHPLFCAWADFHHGTATFHVPAGTYWAVGEYAKVLPMGSWRLDVLPQFTVRGDTTVITSERASSSKATFVTPRPAIEAGATLFSLGRSGRRGPFYVTWAPGPHGSIWVNPVSRPPTAGTMNAATSTQLISPPGRGAPYAYALDYPAPPGTIPAQHYVVHPGDLATIHERYYQDPAQNGWWDSLGGTARQFRTVGFSAGATRLRLPGDQTLYLTARPAMFWQTGYAIAGVSSGQTSSFRLLHAGKHLSEAWNRYPLHTAPNVSLPRSIFRVVPSASRAKNTLFLDVTPFSDNTFGHLGNGFNSNGGPASEVSGSYALYQNGTEIASGKAPPSDGDLLVIKALNPSPARITFMVTASRKGQTPNLSSASQDVWTWPSRPDPAATVPAPWYCGANFTHGHFHFDQHCAVQDMMTLSYQVAGLSMKGTTHPGRQDLDITVSHLQQATPSRITTASAQVSYDNGSTWQQATVSRAGAAQFHVSYTASASATVSLRITARDAAGATLTETILHAYQTSTR